MTLQTLPADEPFEPGAGQVAKLCNQVIVSCTLTVVAEAIALADAGNLKLTVGYTRRFDPKYAYVNKAIKEGLIGEPVTCLVSRNVTRELGDKITGRGKLSPATMGRSNPASHDRV